MSKDNKPKDRRKFLLATLPFAIPFSNFNFSFEQSAQAQDSGASMAIMFKEFLNYYQNFEGNFKKLQETVGNYYNSYDKVKNSYDTVTKQLKKEKDRFDSVVNINSVESFLNAELPRLPKAVDAIFNVYNKTIAPYEDIIKVLRKDHPKKSDEVMTPKEVKYHHSREARGRHSLGVTASINNKEETKKLKKEIFKYSNSEKDNEKSAGELFEKQSSHIKQDTLQNIDETLLRLEAIMIRFEEKINEVDSNPKKFEKKEWTDLLVSFRKGNGTLTETET